MTVSEVGAMPATGGRPPSHGPPMSRGLAGSTQPRTTHVAASAYPAADHPRGGVGLPDGGRLPRGGIRVGHAPRHRRLLGHLFLPLAAVAERVDPHTDVSSQVLAFRRLLVARLPPPPSSSPVAPVQRVADEEDGDDDDDGRHHADDEEHRQRLVVVGGGRGGRGERAGVGAGGSVVVGEQGDAHRVDVVGLQAGEGEAGVVVGAQRAGGVRGVGRPVAQPVVERARRGRRDEPLEPDGGARRHRLAHRQRHVDGGDGGRRRGGGDGRRGRAARRVAHRQTDVHRRRHAPELRGHGGRRATPTARRLLPATAVHREAGDPVRPHALRGRARRRLAVRHRLHPTQPRQAAVAVERVAGQSQPAQGGQLERAFRHRRYPVGNQVQRREVVETGKRRSSDTHYEVVLQVQLVQLLHADEQSVRYRRDAHVVQVEPAQPSALRERRVVESPQRVLR